MPGRDVDRDPKDIGVFVLAKNEQANIGRCLESLRGSGWEVTVLDSGSSDDTLSIVGAFDFARIESYAYSDHCKAYNEITTGLAGGYRYVLVLDADMMVSGALQSELKSILLCDEPRPQVVAAEIEMYVEGQALKFGSLCPPKAFVFAFGKPYFVSVGHGEALASGVTVARTREPLRHDDRKSYAAYLQSQARYSRNLVIRKVAGQLSGKDRIRTTTPLMIFVVPFVSYILKGGFLSGKAGIIYALDRLIAEAIMYRRALRAIVDE